MKAIRWNDGKNARLWMRRGVGFELAALKIASGDVLDIVDGDKRRYPNQRIYILELGGYAYLVPFVETEDEIFLKTVIPSRKATRRFLRGGRRHG